MLAADNRDQRCAHRAHRDAHRLGAAPRPERDRAASEGDDDAEDALAAGEAELGLAPDGDVRLQLPHGPPVAVLPPATSLSKLMGHPTCTPGEPTHCRVSIPGPANASPMVAWSK